MSMHRTTRTLNWNSNEMKTTATITEKNYVQYIICVFTKE